MISKKEVIFGTYAELEEYCNSMIRPACEKSMATKVGDKFYMPDGEFKMLISNIPGIFLLPYLEVREYNLNIEPEISFELKTMWLKVITA